MTLDPEGLQVPAIFLITEQDDIVDNDSIRLRHEELVADGIPTQFIESMEYPLDPLRFMRVPTLTEQESQGVFQDMVQFGLVNAQGNRLIEIDDYDDAIDAFKDVYEGPQQAKVTRQLKVVWTVHVFDGWWADDEVDFFLTHL
jgi:hypothetical protein